MGLTADNLNEAKTDFTELNVFERFQPKIPQEYADTEFLFLANIQPTLAGRCPAQNERGAPDRLRHHELLDPAHASANWQRP